MKIFSILSLIALSGCITEKSQFTVQGSTPSTRIEAVPPKGSPILFKEVIISGVNVGKASWCDPDHPGPGHFIPVTHGGDYYFDDRPRGGCVWSKDGFIPFLKQPQGPQQACATVNTHGFLMAVHSAFKEQGIKSIGVGIHKCPAAPTGSGATALSGYRRGISINDWNDANKAVAVVARVMKQWKLRGTFDVRVKSIPTAVNREARSGE
ncbi:hypothetical protein KKF84_21635 [Myxococcota bacterium]|nr:hypothetical protein [Myxococcota bacterium]MBU1537929.1 hypothetical protein [Myxococcota bacterium]